MNFVFGNANIKEQRPRNEPVLYECAMECDSCYSLPWTHNWVNMNYRNGYTTGTNDNESNLCDTIFLNENRKTQNISPNEICHGFVHVIPNAIVNNVKRRISFAFFSQSTMSYEMND